MAKLPAVTRWKRLGAAVKRGDLVRATAQRCRRLLPAPEGEIALALGRGRTARAVSAPDLHAEAWNTLEIVLDKLGSLHPLLAPVTPRRPYHLAFREDDQEALQGALAALPTWMTVVGDVEPGAQVMISPRFAVNSRLLPVAADLQVTISVMARQRGVYTSRALTAPDRIAADEWEALSRRSLSRERRAPGPPEPGVEIDAVYTWVDGDDPDWRARRDAALGGHGESALHASAVDRSRFLDAGELRHSLRSLHRYANWVRRIYIVTDSQVPSWLDVSHPRIRVVSHQELIGASRFNSHAIEASLHRIPDLAEHYLYLNDDVFFGNMAYPGDFFAAPGISRFFPSDLTIDPGPASIEDRPIMAAAKNGRDLMAMRFGLDIRTRVRHTVQPQLRSVAQQIEAEHPEQVACTRAAAFRSPTDISLASSLHHWYAYALGRAVPAHPNYLYVDLGRADTGQTLDALESLRRYDTFCLNQEEGELPGATRRDLARFLNRYLPGTAPWELT